MVTLAPKGQQATDYFSFHDVATHVTQITDKCFHTLMMSRGGIWEIWSQKESYVSVSGTPAGSGALMNKSIKSLPANLTAATAHPIPSVVVDSTTS